MREPYRIAGQIVGQVQRNVDGVIAELLSLSYPRSAYTCDRTCTCTDEHLRRVHARLPRGHGAWHVSWHVTSVTSPIHAKLEKQFSALAHM